MGASGPAQGDMHQFCGGINPDWIPVPNPVGDDHPAVLFLVKSGPVSEHCGAESALFIQHQLPSMRVSREHQGHTGIRGGIKSVRMMRHQDRECILPTLVQEIPHRIGYPLVVPFS